LRWVEDHNVLVALKIADIEGEKLVDSVNHHRGDEAGVMGVLATDLVLNNQPLLLRENGRSVVKEPEKSLEAGEFGMSLSRHKP
jgi:hypothetical protein